MDTAEQALVLENHKLLRIRLLTRCVHTLYYLSYGRYSTPEGAVHIPPYTSHPTRSHSPPQNPEQKKIQNIRKRRRANIYQVTRYLFYPFSCSATVVVRIRLIRLNLRLGLTAILSTRQRPKRYHRYCMYRRWCPPVLASIHITYLLHCYTHYIILRPSTSCLDGDLPYQMYQAV